MPTIMKWINGFNRSKEYLQQMADYIADMLKTEQRKWVGTNGCTVEHPIEDMHTVKRLYHKSHGKQGEQFTLMPWPDDSSITNEEYMQLAREVAMEYSDFQCMYALHLDSKHRHLHFILNSVCFANGLKFSQGPGDLNKHKVNINHALEKHGFCVIRAGADEIRDDTDYSDAVGFDYLEIDEQEDKTSVPSYDFSEGSDYDFSPVFSTNPDYPDSGYHGFFTPSNPYSQFRLEETSMNYNFMNSPIAPATLPPVPTHADAMPPEPVVNEPYQPESMPQTYVSTPTPTAFDGITFRPEVHIKPPSDADPDTIQARALRYQYEAAKMGAVLGMELRRNGNTEPYCINLVVEIDLTADTAEAFPDDPDTMDTEFTDYE